MSRRPSRVARDRDLGSAPQLGRLLSGSQRRAAQIRSSSGTPCCELACFGSDNCAGQRRSVRLSPRVAPRPRCPEAAARWLQTRARSGSVSGPSGRDVHSIRQGLFTQSQRMRRRAALRRACAAPAPSSGVHSLFPTCTNSRITSHATRSHRHVMAARHAARGTRRAARGARLTPDG